MTQAIGISVEIRDSTQAGGAGVKRTIEDITQRARQMDDQVTTATGTLKEFADRGLDPIRTAAQRAERGVEEFSGAGRRAERHLEQMGRTLESIDHKMDRLGKTSGATTRLLRGLGVGLGTFLGVELVRSIGQAGFEMADLASRVALLRGSFLEFSVAAGVSPNKVLKDLEKGSRDTLSEVQALTLANTALATGVQPLIENLGQIVGQVRQLSQALGRDANEDISRFIGAIQKQERELLDDLTIVVSADEAYKKLAKSLGVSTEKLTATQRQTAFANEALRQLDVRVRNLGPTTNDFADRLARTSAAFSDIKASLGFLTAPAFLNAAESIQNLLGDKQVQQNIAALASGFSALAVGAVHIASALGSIVLKAGDLSPLAGRLREWADSSIVSFLGFSKAIRELADALEKLKITAGGALDAGLPDQGTQANPVVAGGVTTTAGKPLNYREIGKTLLQGVADVETAFAGLNREFDVVASTAIGVGQALGKTNAVGVATPNVFGAATLAVGALIALFGDAVNPINKLRSSLEHAADASKQAADAVAGFVDRLQEQTRIDLGQVVGSGITLNTLIAQFRGFATDQYLENFQSNVTGQRDPSLDRLRGGDPNEILNLFYGNTGAEEERLLRAFADHLGTTVEELLSTLTEVAGRFPGLDLADAAGNPFQAVQDIFVSAQEQLARFGQLDLRTFAGASEDFSFRQRIARDGTDPVALFRESFGQILEQFNVEDLSYVLKEGVELSSAQERGLQELLAELRDFHADSNAANRASNLYFDKEEAALRARFAQEFTGVAANDRVTSKEFDRQIQALYQTRLAYERAGAVLPGGSGSAGAGGYATTTGSSGGSAVKVGTDALAEFPTLGELEASIEIMLSEAVASILKDELIEIDNDRPLLAPEILIKVPDNAEFRSFFEGTMPTAFIGGLREVVDNLKPETPIAFSASLIDAPGQTDFYFRFADHTPGRLLGGLRQVVGNIKLDTPISFSSSLVDAPQQIDFFQRLADNTPTRLLGGLRDVVSNLTPEKPIAFSASLIDAPGQTDFYFRFADNTPTRLLGGLRQVVDNLHTADTVPFKARLIDAPEQLQFFFRMADIVPVPFMGGLRDVVDNLHKADTVTLLTDVFDGPDREAFKVRFEGAVVPSLRGGLDDSLKSMEPVTLSSSQLFKYSVGIRLFEPNQLAGLNTYLSRVELERDALYQYNINPRPFGPTSLASFNKDSAKINLSGSDLFTYSIAPRPIPATDLGYVTGSLYVPVAFPGKVSKQGSDFLQVSPVVVDIKYNITNPEVLNQPFIPTGLFDRGNA